MQSVNVGSIQCHHVINIVCDYTHGLQLHAKQLQTRQYVPDVVKLAVDILNLKIKAKEVNNNVELYVATQPAFTILAWYIKRIYFYNETLI